MIELNEVVSEIIKDDADKYDIDYVESGTLSMEEETGRINLMGKKDKSFMLTGHAAQQFCKTYSIPYDFWVNKLDRYDKSYIFNKFVKDEKAFYLRCRKDGNGGHTDMIRAILSDKFVPLDNRFVIEQIKEFADRSDYKIANFNLDDDSLHLRMVMDSEKFNVGNDTEPDIWMFGIHISNSEVGKRSTAIDGALFRLICENGNVMMMDNKHFLNVMHRGETEEKFKEKFNDAIWESISYVRNMQDGLKESMNVKLHEPSENILITSMENAKLSEAFIDEVVSEYKNNGNTLYSFVNALTLNAQKEDWDRRYDIEKLAGSWLAKPSIAA